MWDLSAYELKRSYPLVMLAGGELGGRPKALIELKGRPMIYYVMRAVAALKGLGDIAIACPDEVSDVISSLADELELEVRIAPSGASPLESFQRGLEGLKLEGDPLVVALATDTPLVTSEALQDAISRIDMLEDVEDIDMAYLVVSEEAYRIRFPKSRRTFVRLRRGGFCGTGLVAIRPSALRRLLEVAEPIVRGRKSPLAMASVIGWDVLLGLITRRYTLLDLEEKISRRFGMRGKVLLSEYPELAFNVDEEDEVRLAEELLAECQGGDET